MFTWICPQCGAEVPPAYNDCPNCKPVVAAAPPVVAAPPPPPAVAVPRPMAAPPTPTAPTPTAPLVAYQLPQAPAYQTQPVPQQQQPSYYPPPPKAGLPAWLVTVGVFLGLIAAGYAFYSLVLNKNGTSAATATETPAAPETAAAPAGRRTQALVKHLEAAGVRILEENRKPVIRLMVVNHSSTELTQLSGSVQLTTDGQNELAVIPFNLAALGPFESKEISAPLKTKMRAYELPDWQFIKAKVTLNSSGSE